MADQDVTEFDDIDRALESGDLLYVIKGGTEDSNCDFDRIVSAIVNTKLDDFTTPDDTTDLDATITYHGLCPKLSNDVATWLDGTGSWSAPTAAEVGAGSASDVADNTTHSGSSGTDHGLIDQSVIIGSAPSFIGTNIVGIISGSVENVHVNVRKGAAGSIPAQTPLYLSGYNVGGWVEVEVADASNAATMPSIAIANVVITNSATVLATVSGELSGLSTSGAINDPVFVASGGGVTGTKPIGTNLIQKIGIVTRVHGSQGVITVVGAGRTNDVPNIPNNYFWLGNAIGVATPKNFDTEVSSNITVTANSVAIASLRQHTIYLPSFAGSGAPIVAGTKGLFVIPFDCKISAARILADQSTTTTVDIWKTDFANYDAGVTHPVVSDSIITPGALIKLSAEVKSEDTSLTDWDTTFIEGDIIAINVTTNDRAVFLFPYLEVTRT